ncbi:hypothetical protein [Comamonas sp.]|uniref:hypothetical protein n=1 Tax=Comamonas sp. TaxID=34028 RepID=UPI00289AF845|nr:hypothetical protein [Comamonas sp.]
MFTKIAHNDDAVKAIFDHIRNVGIAGVTYSAGSWLWGKAPEDPWAWALGIKINAVLIMGVGLLLGAIMLANGWHKLHKTEIPFIWRSVLLVLHSVIFVYLFNIGLLQAIAK